MSKKLTIFNGGQRLSEHVKMFFDLNNNNYEFVSDRQHSEIDIALNVSMDTDMSAKIYVDLDIFHNYENQIDNKQWPKNWYYITNAINKKSYVSPQVISVDFAFNYWRAYYQKYPFRPGTKKWYYVGADAYPELDIPLSGAKIFIFLAPNKTYRNSRYYRTQLVNFLKHNFSDRSRGFGFIGNYDDSPELRLHSHVDFKTVPNDSHDLFLLKDTSKPMVGIKPIHNSYYYHTFISIYVETIEYGDTVAVTEKTYEPLLRGHFILPFSTTGFIQHLKELGFIFPEFIDYSYDSILDTDMRYSAYENEIRRLMEFDIQTWRSHWDQNLDLLYHNKKMFVERPYDRIDFDSLIQSTKG